MLTEFETLHSCPGDLLTYQRKVVRGQLPANVRRAGERHKIVRQTDSGLGVDARASSGGPLSPDLAFARQASSS